MGHAIATQEGLSIEYDEDVCCDVCQSVSCLNKLCTVSYCIYRNKDVVLVHFCQEYYQELWNLLGC